LASVHAVQDMNAARVGELCASCGIPKACATAAELLADPEVDAVYIAVPNKFHVPLAIQALEAGKHVILEKPFAMNYAEALLAAEAARKCGRVLTLGMNQRFGQNPQKIKALVEKGVFGEIYHAKAYWLRRSGIPRLGTWFGNRDIAGGGCLYDIGVHLLDLCLYVIGRFDATAVSGNTYTKFGNRGLGEGGWGKSDREDARFDVEDFASAHLRFPDGLSVSLDAAWACHTSQAHRLDVELFGTEAGAQVMDARIFRRDAQLGEYVIAEGFPAAVRYPHGERFHNFINHLLEGEELCVTLDQALAVQRILDGIAESSRLGREVVL
ncbi:MAG TPA: Gfo/Idh/MocA family oxidoreductase, partial [Chthoniobacterales bacterium]